MKQVGRIVLASASPRRKEFFDLLGIRVEVMPANVPEGESGGNPQRLPLRNTVEKLKAVRTKLGPGFAGWLIGADTVVALGRRVLGKPKNRQEAKRMLTELSGNRHKVFTGYRVQKASGQYREGVVETMVEMVPMTEAQIDWYVESGEPDDKAGAYAIQGKGGAFVRTIVGSYSNVVGLPLVEVLTALRELKAIED
ncbi:MAG: Maf family protein [Pseudomonadota bacterium]